MDKTATEELEEKQLRRIHHGAHNVKKTITSTRPPVHLILLRRLHRHHRRSHRHERKAIQARQALQARVLSALAEKEDQTTHSGGKL